MLIHFETEIVNVFNFLFAVNKFFFSLFNVSYLFQHFLFCFSFFFELSKQTICHLKSECFGSGKKCICDLN